MSAAAIVVRDLHKEFILPQHKVTSLKQVFVGLGRRSFKKKLKVLDAVNLQINSGEFFGIIGRNGSGKSTLLKILAGVYTPTSGSVSVHGSLTPFIELGVGFNPELSGRDNVYLNGALLGFSHAEMTGMYDDIVSFAELSEFMDQKLKNYSSGMQVRLAFSIAVRAKSDILLVDEVLAVGDTNFQRKCMEMFEALKREGRTIIFITHSMNYVRDFCDRVAVISSGKVIYIGETEKGIDTYNQLNVEAEDQRLKAENMESVVSHRIGNGKVVITGYQLLNRSGRETQTLETGAPFEAVFTVETTDVVKNCAFGIMFRKNPQENLFGINSFLEGHTVRHVAGGQKMKIRFKDTMPLNPGTYYVSFAVSSMSKTGYEDLDNLHNIMRVNVVGRQAFWGLVHSEPNVSIAKEE